MVSQPANITCGRLPRLARAELVAPFVEARNDLAEREGFEPSIRY